MTIHKMDSEPEYAVDLKMALEASGIVGLWDWDLIGNVVRYDRGAAMLLASNPNLAGKPLRGLTSCSGVHPDDMEWLTEEASRVMNVGGLFLAEYRVLMPDGDLRWLLSRGRIYLNAIGQATRGCGILIDTTESHTVGQGSVEGASSLLHDAVQDGIHLHQKLQADGTPLLCSLIDTLLMTMGHEIATRMQKTLV